MVPSDALAPSGIWTATGVVAVLDALLLALLVRRVRPPFPRSLTPRIGLIGAVFFAAIFGWSFSTFWASCYGPALPALMRPLAPALGAALGAFGSVLWLVARRAGCRAVPLFLLLGGAESLPGHANAIERFGLLERCPLLEAISPTSAYVFGVFEFAFYWSVVVGLAWLWARREPSGQG